MPQTYPHVHMHMMHMCVMGEMMKNVHILLPLSSLSLLIPSSLPPSCFNLPATHPLANSSRFNQSATGVPILNGVKRDPSLPMVVQRPPLHGWGKKRSTLIIPEGGRRNNSMCLIPKKSRTMMHDSSSFPPSSPSPHVLLFSFSLSSKTEAFSPLSFSVDLPPCSTPPPLSLSLSSLLLGGREEKEAYTRGLGLWGHSVSTEPANKEGGGEEKRAELFPSRARNCDSLYCIARLLSSCLSSTNIRLPQNSTIHANKKR